MVTQVDSYGQPWDDNLVCGIKITFESGEVKNGWETACPEWGPDLVAQDTSTGVNPSWIKFYSDKESINGNDRTAIDGFIWDGQLHYESDGDE